MNNERARLSAGERDAKFGPLYNAAKVSRKAHADLTRARNTGAAADAIASLETMTKEADAKAQSLVGSYAMADLKMALAYFQDAIFTDNLSADGRTFNYNQARWDAKALMSLPDDRALADGNKDRRQSLKELRQRSVEAFIGLCQTLSVIPRKGLNDSAVRFVVSKADERIANAQANGQRATVAELREAKNRLASSVPQDWLKEREQRAPNPTVGDALGTEQVATLHQQVNETPQPKKQRRSR
ncbi:MAG: hypothetical protein HYY86_01595 [Candidatus Harrisonbacteria bacterium]|nr:hypothetical protein [Candidatus Harrisonbacteria bacterium]